MMEKEKRVDVLLVEDSLDDSELTGYALEIGNDRVHFLHLKDGVEAINFIFPDQEGAQGIYNNLSLILLDLKLPKLDGLEVLKRIRSDERTRNIPVVILSSSNEIKDIKEAYTNGVNSYVVKPVEYEKYISTVSAISAYWSRVNRKSVV